MKLGFSSTCIWSINPVEGIKFAEKLGVYSFELWADHFFMNNDSAKEIKHVYEETGIIPTVHSSSWDLNLTSTSMSVRDFSKERVEKSIDLAVEIGARVITIHPGRKSFYRADRKEITGTQREVFHELFEYSGAETLKICIENIENSVGEVMVNETDFIDFFSGFNDSLCVTMDVAHLGSFEKFKNFYSVLKDRICHIHISDLNQNEIHITMGDGVLETDKIFSFLKGSYNGIFSLEFYGNDPEGNEVEKSILYLRNIERKIGWAD